MKIIECPRDAMQGMDLIIPTEQKIAYLNRLLAVGFDTIDAGSFVSSKVIPQMRDTREVLDGIDRSVSTTRLLVIVANTRGAEDACKHPAVTYIGFPLSVSETFQKRNTNKSIAEALTALDEIQNLCTASGKTLVAYISMGFGNPYGDPYDQEIVGKFVDVLSTMGVTIVSLADTVGVATPEHIHSLYASVLKDFPGIELGLHLHSTPDTAVKKIQAAIDAGCKRIDGAMKGYGGCPMANDSLVGNLATETIVSCLESNGIAHGLNMTQFSRALQAAGGIFSYPTGTGTFFPAGR